MDASPRDRRARRLAHTTQRITEALEQHHRPLATPLLAEPAPPTTPFEMLALSGGGQWGAFGAGFLKGWSERTAAPLRPEFQVVNGTSTGALLATFAFLGPAYDDAIGHAYLDIRDDADVYSKRGLDLVGADSLTTREQFRDRLERIVSREVVAAVATEAGRGRRLFVGATDLMAGDFHVFDLTAIAAGEGTGGTAHARRDYVDALMASSAIPFAFPVERLVAAEGDEPPTVRRFVDGGIRRNIFAEAFTGALRAQPAERRSAAIWCLVNGPRDVDEITRLSPWFAPFLGVAQRAVDILLTESTEGNLFRIALQAGQLGVPCHVTAIPHDMAQRCRVQAAHQDSQFDHGMMQALYDAGRDLAKSGDCWQDDPLAGSS